VALPYNIEAGSGCRRCAINAHRKTHEEHVRRVAAVHGRRIKVVGRFKDSTTAVIYACRRHGKWSASPHNVERGSGCARCYRDKRHSGVFRKPHAIYVSEAAAFGVKVLDHYKAAVTPIRHRCLARGHVFEARPNDVLSGYGCPLCDTSQWRRRPICVGDRKVLVQGSEGFVVAVLLREGVQPDDLAFSSTEGRPCFRYRYLGRDRTYVPDMFVKSSSLVVEAKSQVTFGLFDKSLYEQVRSKAAAVLTAGYPYRLIIVHRGRCFDPGPAWTVEGWRVVRARYLKARAKADRRKLRRTAC
jgi:hypothetical protein